MATHGDLPDLMEASGSASAVDMYRHVLEMHKRHAQNHVLDSLLQKSGKDTTEDFGLSCETDEQDIVGVDLRNHKKMEHVREQMDKAGATEKVVLGSERISLLSERISSPGFWNTVLTKFQPGNNPWEPPSPAKSSHSGRCCSPGEEGSPSDALVARSVTLGCSEYGSREQTAELEPQGTTSCAIQQNNFFATAICAALNTRTLVLLWYRGVLGPIHGNGTTYPALLTLDQLDAELLATKLEPKESLSLLYDLDARLGEGSLKEMELRQCCLCQEFKLWLSEPSRTLQVLHEFPRWKTKSRCAHKVCTTCTVKHMIGAFDEALWMASGGIKFRCPMAGCSRYLGQFSKGDGVGSYALVPPPKDRLFMDACYKMLMELKSIIKKELPNLSAESRAMGEQTASILRQDGYMMTVAEATKNPRLIQLEGTGTITSMSAVSDSAYEIPVLVKLLKRQKRAQRCVCCQRSIREVEIQDPRHWRKTMSRCVGQSPHSPTAWGLHLLSFPLEFSGGCAGHPFICVQCLRVAIGSDKNSVKKSPVQVSCPSWGCHYVLGHKELRACLASSVRKVYDWAHTNYELVSTPGFTWCSEPGCDRGQVCEASGPATCQSCGGSLCSGPPSE